MNTAPAHWLSPVGSRAGRTARQVLKELVGDRRMYAFGERAAGRSHIRSGDWICFYETSRGIVGHARIVSSPALTNDLPEYPWLIHLDDVHLYPDSPVVVAAPLRGKLEAFRGKNPAGAWSWFVQSTHRVSERDFGMLTRAE